MTYEEDYQKIRDLLPALHMKIIKQLSRDDMNTSGRHLGMLHKKTFVFNNQTEIAVLSDYQVYSYRPHGISMVERYLKAKRNSLYPFTVELLEAMCRARFSIYMTGEAQKGKGLAVTDAFRHESFFLADRSLSTSSEPDMLLVLRLITFDDFAIQTGAGILIEPALIKRPDVVDALNKYLPEPEGEKFYFTPEQESKFARAILVACIRHGYTEHIRYE
jgi:hypothetical protein